MSSSEYNYDEEGETWPFFVLALLTFVLLPLTIKYATRIFSPDPEKINATIEGSIKENGESVRVPNLAAINVYKNKKKSLKVFNKTLVLLIIGWSLVIYVGKYLTKEANMTGMFDPYSILDVSFSASEREIKSHYRKLSLKYHPDKLPRDLTEEARLKMEQEYIRLTSAYKALTDEATRENFIRYGHPDGEQPITHGIALPKFLVEGKYSSIVVVFYFALIGLLLPIIVGKWWSNVKSHTRKGLHVQTAGDYVLKFADKDPAKIITPDTILEYVLESQEVDELLPGLSLKEKKALVEEHLNRKFDLNNDKHERQKVELIAMLPFLVDGLIDIAIAFRLHEVIFAAEDLKRAVIQAVPISGKHQDILQLPFVDKDVVQKQPVKKLGKLLTLSQNDAKKALGITNEADLIKALRIAELLPTLRVIDAKVMVPGEESVPPHSNAHVSIKFLVKSPRLKSCPEIVEDGDDERLKDEETLEYMKNPMIVNDKQPTLPFAYAPYFPQSVRNKWSCYLISQSENKLVDGSSSYNLEKIDLSNLKLTQEEWEKGEKVTISTYKFPLPTAVGNVGKVYYRLVMKNSTYYGADVDIPIDLEVTPVSKEKSLAGVKKLMETKQKESEADSDEEEYEDSDSDISDPEEDSLAGALAALRGEMSKKSAKAGKRSAHEQGSEDEGDDEEEEEEEEVFTDINTDTEDEAEDEAK